MTTAIKLPELGDGIESGDILEVLVKTGDVIKSGQSIVEIETDKASMPVPSPTAGKVVNILVKLGDTVPIGGTLIELEAADAPTSSPAAPAKPVEKAAPAAAAAPVAAKPSEPQPTPPAAPPPEAAPAPVAKATPPAPTPVAVAPAAISDEVIPAGPAMRRLAREVGVNRGVVAGSGDNGRITRDDIMAAARQSSQSASQSARATSSVPTGTPPTAKAASAAPAASSTSNAADDHGPLRVERMTKIRKTIAAKMHASWSTVPRVTNFDDADITDLEYLRQTSKEDYAAQGLKLTTMPFLIKAVATALRHHPEINATVDSENDQIIYKEYVNVGIAVDTDNGLVVPVLRNVDRMGIPEITRTLAEMAAKMRGGQVAISDLRGGTFTISNLGAIGGQYSTPIVNVPEVAILLVGRSRKLPVVMPDDSIKPRLMMPLSLSYDHRLVDGGTAARFLNDVIGYLQAPSRLLLAL